MMGRSMAMLVGILGMVLSTTYAAVLPDKHAGMGHNGEFGGWRGVKGGLRNLKQSSTFGPALLGAADTGDVTGVQRILDAGADPNYVDDTGKWTALIVAASRGHVDVIRVLLAAGASIGFRNDIEATALEYAAVRGYADAVQVLLEAGADPNQLDDKGLNPIHRASIEGHTDVVEELVAAGGDITIRAGGDSSGDIPLAYAARNGHLGLVRLFVRLGADVNDRNTKYQQTPLHRAAAANSGSIIIILIDAGAEVDAADIDGDTPLFTAAFFGHQEAIEVLLESGADKTKGNFKDITPRDALCQCQFASTVSDDCQVEACDSSARRLINLLDP